jgi:hypothetical protein
LNQRDSPLLRLPAELRNTIYEFAFRTNTVTVPRYIPIDTMRPSDKSRWQPKGPAALLLVSRQIRYESSVLFYQLSTFNLSICFIANDLRTMIGSDNSSHVKSIRIGPEKVLDILRWVERGEGEMGAFYGLEHIDVINTGYNMD